MSTANEVAASFGDLSGRVCLVTGCSNGLGFECARALRLNGATVVMACRKGEKADRACEQLRELTTSSPRANVHLLELDLGDAESVRACAAAFKKLGLPLNALVCNAGINGVPVWAQHTPGVETQFAVNYLGHFLLQSLLHHTLEQTPGARVVVISSEGHRRVSTCGFDLSQELPPRQAAYDPMHAYAFSNLCRALWARELAKRVPYPVVAVHPGVTGGTGMLQHMSWTQKVRQIWLVARHELSAAVRGQSAEQSAATQTWAALVPSEELAAISGAYLNGNLGRELGKPDTPSPLAQNDDYAKRVFEFAEAFFRADSINTSAVSSDNSDSQ